MAIVIILDININRFAKLHKLSERLKIVKIHDNLDKSFPPFHFPSRGFLNGEKN